MKTSRFAVLVVAAVVCIDLTYVGPSALERPARAQNYPDCTDSISSMPCWMPAAANCTLVTIPIIDPVTEEQTGWRIYCSADACDSPAEGCSGGASVSYCLGAQSGVVPSIKGCYAETRACGVNINGGGACNKIEPEDPEDFENYSCNCKFTITTEEPCNVEDAVGGPEPCVPPNFALNRAVPRIQAALIAAVVRVQRVF